MESSTVKQSEDTLRELYAFYTTANDPYARLCLAWDIIELYLARAAKTHDWEAELKYLSKSNVLASLFRVLCMDPHYRVKLQNIEGVTPTTLAGRPVEFTTPKTISELVSLVRQARNVIFTGEAEPSVLKELVKVLDDVLKPLVKELVPCT